MKKIEFAMNLSVLVLLILVIIGVISVFKNNLSLKDELKNKSSALRESEDLLKHLRELQKQEGNLKLQAEKINIKVPSNESKPFALIKEIFKFRGELGLRKMAFNLKDASSENKGQKGLSGQEMTKPQQETVPGGQKQEGGGQSPSEPSVQEQIGAPKPVYLDMSFEATFQQLNVFLERLMNYKRLLSVENLKIEREKDILPYQKISLKLVAYSF